VIDKFTEADPHHGEAWSKEIKKVDNWRKNTVDLIKIVAKNIRLFDEN
jgi:hypothetical protein